MGYRVWAGWKGVGFMVLDWLRAEVLWFGMGWKGVGCMALEGVRV